MSDIIDELNAVHREVGRAGEARTVVLRRSYPVPIEDVWDAVTTAERISRWLLPVTGDLRLGGKYQLEGNAGGEILTCEPPRLLKVSWIFGDAGGLSEVEVRLSSGTSAETVFELEHTATVPDDMWTEYGPGAVGVGWDLALLGLGLQLSGVSIGDPDEWSASPEGRDYIAGSSQAWGAAHEASGASHDTVEKTVANTTAFYTPPASS